MDPDKLEPDTNVGEDNDEDESVVPDSHKQRGTTANKDRQDDSTDS